MTIRSASTLLLLAVLAAACDGRGRWEDRRINPWVFSRVRESTGPCVQLCDEGAAASLPSCAARCEWLLASARQIDISIGDQPDHGRDGACSEALGAALTCGTQAGDDLALQCSSLFTAQARECGESLYDAGWQACHEHCDDAMLEAEPAYPSWFECQRRCAQAQPV